MELETLLKKLAQPAQRAIRGSGAASLEDLARMGKRQVAGLHGIGKNALITIEDELKNAGLSWEETQEKPD